MTSVPVARPSVVYVSYDGALDPLGSSQVVSYLVGLSAFARIALVSFEKERRWQDAPRREAMRARLASSGIAWRPLRYHARPRLPATVWDIALGAQAIAKAVRETEAVIVHCRGEVAMVMARLARLAPATRLLLDRRGFFADERVESGSWAAGGPLDRAVRRAEAANLRAAHGLVVLTESALEAMRSGREELPPAKVIATCVDTVAFHPASPTEPRSYSTVYVGSLGTWYMVDEMIALAREIAAVVPGRALFLTPDTRLAEQAGASPDWADVRECPPSEVPAWIRCARSSFFVIRPTPAKRASCPTKLGEALASGLPVVANRGIGDVDAFLERDGVGVLVEELNLPGYRAAARKLSTLMDDPDTAERCRRVAEERFSLVTGVRGYRELYDRLDGGRP